MARAKIALARRAVIAALLTLSVALSGCHRSADAPRTITLAAIAYPYQGGTVYNGLTGVVQRDGWLKAQLAKRGIGLAFAPIPTAVGAPLINEGFSAKRIDFASYGDFPAIIAVAGGIPLKLVAPLGQGSEVYLLVRNGVKAHSIADLKGKRIALHRGRPWELPFSKLLDANGLKRSDFTIVNINSSATPAALAAGSVDATVLMGEGLTIEQKGIGHVIWSTKQAAPDWKMRAELFGRGDFVAQHPDLTQLVVDAYVRAAAWSAQDANRERVTADAARGSSPIGIIREDYAGANYPWRERFSPIFRPDVRAHYQWAANYAEARGLVHDKVDADALLDDRFVTRALQDQKLEGFWSAGSASSGAR